VTSSSPVHDRVVERRRAVALARHFREAEELSIAQIAALLGRSPATVKAYFYDPTGEKARAVKARYRGVCRGCGAYTQPRNGKGDAYAYCKACHPGAIARRWTRERGLEAMRDWNDRYGRLPSSYDCSRTHAWRRGGPPRLTIEPRHRRGCPCLRSRARRLGATARSGSRRPTTSRSRHTAPTPAPAPQYLGKGSRVVVDADGSEDEASTSAEVAVASAGSAPTTEGEASADDLPF
jgi:AraC-like DNA-binding protein